MQQNIDVENTDPSSNEPTSAVTPKTIATQPYSNHLTAQHGNIGCQLFTTGISGTSGSPIAQIPGRLIQTAISVRTFFQPAEKVSALEKAAHGIQAALAITLLAIAIVRYQVNEECTNTQTPLCKNDTLCQTLYATMLLVGWGPSQMTNYSKKQKTDVPTSEPADNAHTTPELNV